MQDEEKQSPKRKPYRLWFSGNDVTLWIDLKVASRAAALWAAERLADACARLKLHTTAYWLMLTGARCHPQASGPSPRRPAPSPGN